MVFGRKVHRSGNNGTVSTSGTNMIKPITNIMGEAALAKESRRLNAAGSKTVFEMEHERRAHDKENAESPVQATAAGSAADAGPAPPTPPNAGCCSRRPSWRSPARERPSSGAISGHHWQSSTIRRN